MVFGSIDWIEVGDEWWLYYAGSDGPHESRERTTGIGLATMRKEGFVSLHGAPGGGVVCTKKLLWPGGGLFVNVDAGAGEMRVCVSDESRQVLPGFAFEDGEAFQGDSVAHEVKWGGRSLDEWKGRVVRVEFHLSNAHLYTFRAGWGR